MWVTAWGHRAAATRLSPSQPEGKVFLEATPVWERQKEWNTIWPFGLKVLDILRGHEEIRCKYYLDHYSNIEEGNHSLAKLAHKVDRDHALVMSPQYQMCCSHNSLINPFFTTAHIPNHLPGPHTKLNKIVLAYVHFKLSSRSLYFKSPEEVQFSHYEVILNFNFFKDGS